MGGYSGAATSGRLQVLTRSVRSPQYFPCSYGLQISVQDAEDLVDCLFVHVAHTSCSLQGMKRVELCGARACVPCLWRRRRIHLWRCPGVALNPQQACSM